MSALVDLTGQKFGRLTVVRRDMTPARKTRWECVCSCGKTVVAQMDNLRSGHTVSCGCFKSEIVRTKSLKHGHYRNHQRSPEYEAWQGIWKRTTNPRQRCYKNYGGRGIKAHEPWRSFEVFLAYLNETIGLRPSPQHSIDRIDNDGDYEPGNVRWATWSEQMKNRRAGYSVGARNPSAKLTMDQVIAIRADKRGGTAIARDYGVSKTVVNRIRVGKIWGSVPWL